MSNLCALNFAFICILLSYKANSAEYFLTDSIYLFNNGPVLSLFNVSRPNIFQNKPEKSITLRTQFEISNYISTTSKNGDQFYIDGETWILRNTLNYQVTSNFNIATSLPYIVHNGGISDSFIYEFHDVFQLPQNGRKPYNKNKLRWVLNKDAQTLLYLDDNLSAWGDLSITGQLTPSNSPSVQWSFMTKFPTGNYDKQTGSEQLDIGISFAQINPKWFKSRSFLSDINLAFWYGTGFSYLGEVSALKELEQKSFIFTFRTGFAHSPFSTWHLKCQLDAQTPLFDTEIRELGWSPIQISFSSQHKLSKKTQFEFVIVEDIRPRSAPDVIFQTNFQTTF